MPYLRERGAVLKPIPTLAAGLLLALSGCVAPSGEAPAPPAPVQTAKPVAGAAGMDPGRSIAENIARSRDHSTLEAALRSTGLLDRLEGTGPFTLFAPTDAAFARLPNGTVQSLMVPANRTLLTQLLNYHVVPGTKTRAHIAADIAAGGGTAAYRTAHGGWIRVSMAGSAITVADGHGNRSSVTIPDVDQSNGVIHILDGVLLPAT